jgi:hypothetical protein
VAPRSVAPNTTAENAVQRKNAAKDPSPTDGQPKPAVSRARSAPPAPAAKTAPTPPTSPGPASGSVVDTVATVLKTLQKIQSLVLAKETVLKGPGAQLLRQPGVFETFHRLLSEAHGVLVANAPGKEGDVAVSSSSSSSSSASRMERDMEWVHTACVATRLSYILTQIFPVPDLPAGGKVRTTTTTAAVGQDGDIAAGTSSAGDLAAMPSAATTTATTSTSTSASAMTAAALGAAAKTQPWSLSREVLISHLRLLAEAIDPPPNEGANAAATAAAGGNVSSKVGPSSTSYDHYFRTALRTLKFGVSNPDPDAVATSAIVKGAGGGPATRGSVVASLLLLPQNFSMLTEVLGQPANYKEELLEEAIRAGDAAAIVYTKSARHAKDTHKETTTLSWSAPMPLDIPQYMLERRGSGTTLHWEQSSLVSRVLVGLTKEIQRHAYFAAVDHAKATQKALLAAHLHNQQLARTLGFAKDISGAAGKEAAQAAVSPSAGAAVAVSLGNDGSPLATDPLASSSPLNLTTSEVLLAAGAVSTLPHSGYGVMLPPSNGLLACVPLTELCQLMRTLSIHHAAIKEVVGENPTIPSTTSSVAIATATGPGDSLTVPPHHAAAKSSITSSSSAALRSDDGTINALQVKIQEFQELQAAASQKAIDLLNRRLKLFAKLTGEDPEAKSKKKSLAKRIAETKKAAAPAGAGATNTTPAPSSDAVADVETEAEAEAAAEAAAANPSNSKLSPEEQKALLYEINLVSSELWQARGRVNQYKSRQATLTKAIEIASSRMKNFSAAMDACNDQLVITLQLRLQAAMEDPATMEALTSTFLVDPNAAGTTNNSSSSSSSKKGEAATAKQEGNGSQSQPPVAAQKPAPSSSVGSVGGVGSVGVGALPTLGPRRPYSTSAFLSQQPPSGKKPQQQHQQQKQKEKQQQGAGAKQAARVAPVGPTQAAPAAPAATQPIQGSQPQPQPPQPSPQVQQQQPQAQQFQQPQHPQHAYPPHFQYQPVAPYPSFPPHMMAMVPSGGPNGAAAPYPYYGVPPPQAYAHHHLSPPPASSSPFSLPLPTGGSGDNTADTMSLAAAYFQAKLRAQVAAAEAENYRELLAFMQAQRAAFPTAMSTGPTTHAPTAPQQQQQQQPPQQQLPQQVPIMQQQQRPTSSYPYYQQQPQQAAAFYGYPPQQQLYAQQQQYHPPPVAPTAFPAAPGPMPPTATAAAPPFAEQSPAEVEAEAEHEEAFSPSPLPQASEAAGTAEEVGGLPEVSQQGEQQSEVLASSSSPTTTATSTAAAGGVEEKVAEQVIAATADAVPETAAPAVVEEVPSAVTTVEAVSLGGSSSSSFDAVTETAVAASAATITTPAVEPVVRSAPAAPATSTRPASASAAPAADAFAMEVVELTSTATTITTSSSTSAAVAHVELGTASTTTTTSSSKESSTRTKTAAKASASAAKKDAAEAAAPASTPPSRRDADADVIFLAKAFQAAAAAAEKRGSEGVGGGATADDAAAPTVVVGGGPVSPQAATAMSYLQQEARSSIAAAVASSFEERAEDGGASGSSADERSPSPSSLLSTPASASAAESAGTTNKALGTVTTTTPAVAAPRSSKKQWTPRPVVPQVPLPWWYLSRSEQIAVATALQALTVLPRNGGAPIALGGEHPHLAAVLSIAKPPSFFMPESVKLAWPLRDDAPAKAMMPALLAARLWGLQAIHLAKISNDAAAAVTISEHNPYAAVIPPSAMPKGPAQASPVALPPLASRQPFTELAVKAAQQLSLAEKTASTAKDRRTSGPLAVEDLASNALKSLASIMDALADASCPAPPYFLQSVAGVLSSPQLLLLLVPWLLWELRRWLSWICARALQ